MGGKVRDIDRRCPAGVRLKCTADDTGMYLPVISPPLPLLCFHYSIVCRRCRGRSNFLQNVEFTNFNTFRFRRMRLSSLFGASFRIWRRDCGEWRGNTGAGM